MSKPTVFVGSSVEQIPLVQAIQRGLRHSAAVNPWGGSFFAGGQTITTLVSKANQADFGVFIFGPDDWVKSRESRTPAPRDNVVFEAGLFGGIIGMDRTLIVHDKRVKLPSDLQGLTPVHYDADADPDAEGQYVCAELIRTIDKLGWRGSESLAGQLSGHWWQFALDQPTGAEQSVLSLIEVERKSPPLVSLKGQAWTDQGKRHARFWSMAANLNEQDKSLFYYWEGDWPGHADAPEFFGKGEIALETLNRAHGYYTVHSEHGVDPRERKATVYLRADPTEVKVMEDDAHIGKRQALIDRQLKLRDQLVFSSGNSRGDGDLGVTSVSVSSEPGKQEDAVPAHQPPIRQI